MTALIPWFLNHLWQSAVCALVAAFLVRLCRRNPAAVRYRLWFAASVKFLIPLSLLAGVGTWFDRPPATSMQRPDAGSAMEDKATNTRPAYNGTAVQNSTPPDRTVEGPSDVAERPPVSASRTPPTRPAATLNERIASYKDRLFQGILTLTRLASPVPVNPSWYGWEWLAPLLFADWLCGAGWCLLSWLRQWLAIRDIARRAMPIELEPPCSIQVRLSADVGEPCVFGILRPVLLLPAGIQEALSSEQLHAIVRHELEHVRRRDNLTAAIHILVEAVFWFFPPVRWIGRQLVNERERACDEAVAATMASTETYAEAIVAVCKRSVRRQMPCVSGVSSLNLKQRVEEILHPVPLRRVGIAFNLLMTATILAPLVGVPFVVGAATSAEIDALTLKAADRRVSPEAVSAGLLRIASLSENARTKVIERLIEMVEMRGQSRWTFDWVAAVDLLGTLRATEAVAPLVHIINEPAGQEPDLDPRDQGHPSARALVKIGDAATPHLLAALKNRSRRASPLFRFEQRALAIDILGRIGGPQSRGALASMAGPLHSDVLRECLGFESFVSYRDSVTKGRELFATVRSAAASSTHTIAAPVSRINMGGQSQPVDKVLCVISGPVADPRHGWFLFDFGVWPLRSSRLGPVEKGSVFDFYVDPEGERLRIAYTKAEAEFVDLPEFLRMAPVLFAGPDALTDLFEIGIDTKKNDYEFLGLGATHEEVLQARGKPDRTRSVKLPTLDATGALRSGTLDILIYDRADPPRSYAVRDGRVDQVYYFDLTGRDTKWLEEFLAGQASGRKVTSGRLSREKTDAARVWDCPDCGWSAWATFLSPGHPGVLSLEVVPPTLADAARFDAAQPLSDKEPLLLGATRAQVLAALNAPTSQMSRMTNVYDKNLWAASIYITSWEPEGPHSTLRGVRIDGGRVSSATYRLQGSTPAEMEASAKTVAARYATGREVKVEGIEQRGLPANRSENVKFFSTPAYSWGAAFDPYLNMADLEFDMSVLTP